MVYYPSEQAGEMKADMAGGGSGENLTFVNELLNRAIQGDHQATESLFPIVYDELRKLAREKLRHERPDHTLQTTALVHEAYLRLVGDGTRRDWDSRRHFCGAAAEAMRRILVEHARARMREKRGGKAVRLPMGDVCPVTRLPNSQVLALDEALQRLAERAPEKYELVKLRYFAGMTIREAAEALGISHATAERHWSYSRAWLYCEMNECASSSGPP